MKQTSVNNKSLPIGSVVKGNVYEYRIESVLGQGSFGITYLASTRIKGPLGEVTVQVALKEFFAKELDSRQADGTVTARTDDGIAHKYGQAFQRESENLSKMKHPGIVNVLEAFEAKGTYYYSMEYLSGGSLDNLLGSSGIPEDQARLLISKICDALSYMHSRKVMHLDLKPKNIMLNGDGSPVVIDFGLSKQYDTTGEPESSSKIGIGTPGYAPLEQATQTSSREFQPTLDIYALGATLFKMLTGCTPPTASEILNEGFPTQKLQEKSVSPTLIEVIRRAMASARKDRLQSVSEFKSLIAASSGKGPDGSGEETIVIGPSQGGSVRKTPPASANNRIYLIIASAILAVALVLFIFAFVNRRGAVVGTSDAKELRVRIDSLESANSSLSKEVRTLRSGGTGSRVQELEDKVKKMQYRIDTLVRANSSLNKEIRTLRSSGGNAKVQELESKIKTLNAKNNTLTKENARLNNEVKSYKPDAERWRRQLKLGE